MQRLAESALQARCLNPSYKVYNQLYLLLKENCLPTEPMLLSTMNQLAFVMIQLGKNLEAMELCENMYSVQATVLEENHPILHVYGVFFLIL
ncbi:hypothetical protein HA402_003055 [Bradysia odoriphaga]|nr:hypothetical protein HA402_003055 [Bradysia odoriphaga]